MKIKLSRAEAKVLYNLLNNIEYPKDLSVISAKFRYARDYNLIKLSRIIDELKESLKFDEEDYNKYIEYSKELQNYQDTYLSQEQNTEQPKVDNNLAKSKFIEITEKYKDTIGLINEKQAIQNKLLNEIIELELRNFKLSCIPDLTPKESNDAFTYHFQNLGLIVDDTTTSDSDKE